jgi:hypothetical protein
MKLIENLHHSDETSGTTIVEINGVEHRAHWTEGGSEVVVTTWQDTPSDWECTGVLRPDGTAHPESLNAIRPFVENPSENARPMTEDEEIDWAEAMIGPE